MKRKMNYVFRLMRAARAMICACAISGSAISASFAATPEPWPITLRTQMQRLATVGFRLDLAATDLCANKAAGTGLGLDSISAYADADKDLVAEILHMGDAPQIAAVVAGSPADAAGIAVGDDLLSINGTPASSILSDGTGLVADGIEQYLAALPVGTPVRLGLRRNSRLFETSVIPRQVCSARFVIKTGKGITAFSDSVNVAVSSELIAFAQNDDELALIAGHELGHVVHRDGEARSLSERRRMEDRADLMGARLATCAGYSPSAGIEFWLRRDRKDWLRMFRDPTHRSRKSRVELIRADIPSIKCPAEALPSAAERD